MRLHASMAEARDVDHVLLNGERLEQVYALDTAEGWVEVLLPREGGIPPTTLDWPKERRKGEVEIVWAIHPRYSCRCGAHRSYLRVRPPECFGCATCGTAMVARMERLDPPRSHDFAFVDTEDGEVEVCRFCDREMIEIVELAR